MLITNTPINVVSVMLFRQTPNPIVISISKKSGFILKRGGEKFFWSKK